MKTLHIKRLTQKVLTSCVMIVFVSSASMITLATASKPIGDLLVLAIKAPGETVTVNGEPAKSGRTIFSASTITTPEHSGAVINLGKSGKIQLEPNTTFLLNANGNELSGDLTAGGLTVLSAAQSVGVRTLTGDLVMLNAGETAIATSGNSGKKAQTGPSGMDWWIWAAIIGGAAAVVIIAVAVTGDEDRVVSPVR